MMLLALLGTPLAVIPLFWLARNTTVFFLLGTGASLAMLIAGGVLGHTVLSFGPVALGAPWYLYVDSLGFLTLGLVLLVAVAVNVFSWGYFQEELRTGHTELRRLQLFYSLLFAFLFSMVLALTTENLGILWIAIEGTTLASAFLVGFENHKRSLEAAWKYMILCTVGIALALLGITVLHLASGNLVGDGQGALSWPFLMAHAERMNPSLLRLAFVFVLVGFGTKAGLAPLHNWLPDAHSQAPSPVSALLSGVLLNSAMYGILRITAVVNRGLSGNGFTGTALLALGILSVGTAAVFLLTQRDYKRLLAYSSIEHMGLLAVGAGLFSPGAIFATLFHMVNHSLTKSMLFLAAGSLYQKFGSRDIRKVRGLLTVLPVTGSVFFFGIFAIAGMPPFSVFFSELGLLTACFQGGHPVIGTLLALLLAVIFVGFAVTLFRIFLGDVPPSSSVTRGEINGPGAVILVVLLVAVGVSGFAMPSEAWELLHRAAQIVIGG